MAAITFSEEFATNYKDWSAVGEGGNPGDDYTSYLISGYKIHGEGNKKFQSNYVTINFGSGDGDGLFFDDEKALFQGIFDYGVSVNSLRWGSTQEISYFPVVGAGGIDFAYGWRRLKVRGSGKALQFKITSETQKPFYINGWIVYVTSNSIP